MSDRPKPSKYMDRCLEPQTDPVYVYRFCVWPDETWNHPRALYEYFRVFNRPTEIHFTEVAF